MVIRDSYEEVNNGDQLDDGYFNGIKSEVDQRLAFVGIDSGSNTGAFTTENEIASVTVPADTVTNGLLVTANYRHRSRGSNSTSNTITTRIRSGSSASFGSNTSFKDDSTKNQVSSIGDGDYLEHDHGFSLTINITGLTWSVINYVQLTASQTTNQTTDYVCTGLTVLRY